MKVPAPKSATPMVPTVVQELPAGTGQREFAKIIVGSREDYERMMANRQTITDFDDMESVPDIRR